MAQDKELKSNRPITALGSPTNAISYVIETIVKNRVNTALPVLVKAVEAGGTGGTAGYVDVMPLICQRDASGEALAPTKLFHLPYFRLQCGSACIVADPVIGDIGLAVFAQQDASNVKAGLTDYVTPDSYRYFDMADGFYFGGFLGQVPSVFVHLDPTGNVKVKAPTKITLEAPDVEVNATTLTVNANMQVNGMVGSTGNITAGSISMQTHTHGGVQTGSGSTGGPQ